MARRASIFAGLVMLAGAAAALAQQQELSLSGVADGVYLLQTEADPDRLLVEADRSSNCGAVYIRLSNMTSSSRSARILGPASACAGTAR